MGFQKTKAGAFPVLQLQTAVNVVKTDAVFAKVGGGVQRNAFFKIAIHPEPFFFGNADAVVGNVQFQERTVLCRRDPDLAGGIIVNGGKTVYQRIFHDRLQDEARYHDFGKRIRDFKDEPGLISDAVSHDGTVVFKEILFGI